MSSVLAGITVSGHFSGFIFGAYPATFLSGKVFFPYGKCQEAFLLNYIPRGLNCFRDKSSEMLFHPF